MVIRKYNRGSTIAKLNPFNKNTVVHCLSMLVHSALTNVNKYNLIDYNYWKYNLL